MERVDETSDVGQVHSDTSGRDQLLLVQAVVGVVATQEHQDEDEQQRAGDGEAKDHLGHHGLVQELGHGSVSGVLRLESDWPLDQPSKYHISD